MRTAIYDMSAMPTTFDVLAWVASVGAIAEDEPVRFVILMDQFREGKTAKDRAMTNEQREARAHRVLAPCCWLLPNATSVQITKDPDECWRWRRSEDALMPGPRVCNLVDLHRQGKEVRRLRAPEWAVQEIGSDYDGVVVLSMRRSPIVPQKNSDQKAWSEAAAYFRSQGERVVVIPDTAEVVGCQHMNTGSHVHVGAAMDVGLRMALYERASLVMSMGCGPALFNALRPDGQCVMFVRHAHMSDGAARKQFEKIWGIGWGEQLPFSPPDQRLDFRCDGVSEIVDAYRSMSGISEAA